MRTLSRILQTWWETKKKSSTATTLVCSKNNWLTSSQLHNVDKIILFDMIITPLHMILFSSLSNMIILFGGRTKNIFEKKKNFCNFNYQQHFNHFDVVEKSQHVVSIFFVIMITHSVWCYDQWPRRWHFAQHCCCGGKGKKKQ